MKIWIDIVHPAQLNFYSNAVKKLAESNRIIVTIINRGKLVSIAKKELGSIVNCEIVPIGRHSGTKYSVIIEANLLRLTQLMIFYRKYKPKIAIGNSFLHGIIGKVFNIPTIMFGDDIGRKFVIFLMVKFSTEMYYVSGSLNKRNYKGISVYNALKEWAYLSPKYFKPDISVLVKYNLKENDYIFVREVITGTLNYHSQDNNSIANITNRFPKGYKVLFSLEDKSTIDYYPKNWILLEEPIKDIHSLIFYSKLLISSGDSMAREGAMLGVPSIYCGVRDMNANNVMIKKRRLFQIEIDEVPNFMDHILNESLYDDKNEFRINLEKEWIDVTEFIIEKINNYKNSKI